MFGRPLYDPEFSQMVIHKYISNEEPTKREIIYWLFDLSFNINLEVQNHSEEASQEITDTFYYESIDYVLEALKQKYGLRDAVIYVRYRLINRKKNALETVELNEVRKMEEKYFENIIILLNKLKKTH